MLKRSHLMIVLLLITIAAPVLNAANPASPQWRENVRAFTRLYGLIRFFYPGDEAAAIDWDRFAVYGVNQVKTTKNRDQLKQTLEKLFMPIAPALVIHHEEEKKTITPPAPPTLAKEKDKFRVVYWQHMGFGQEKDGRIYKSMRVNRLTPDVLEALTGELTGQIDPTPHRGKEVKLRAAFKLIPLDKNAYGQLYMSERREKFQTGFTASSEKGVIRSSQWTYHEITGKLSDDPHRLFCRIRLKQRGQLWVDDIQFFVKENGEWKPVEFDNPGFEKDTPGQAPIEWYSDDRHHTFTVTADTSAKGKKSLLIKSKPVIRLFDKKPKEGEIISKPLGGGLACTFPITLYSSQAHTYPRADAAAFNALKAAIKENTPEKMTWKSRDVRLAGIVISWNIFQHFYPYFDVTGTDWHAQLPKALSEAYDAQSSRDFQMTLGRFTATLKDGHMSVSWSGDKVKRKYPPIAIERIEGKAVVTAVAKDANTGLKPGDILIQRDGEPVEDIIHRIKQTQGGASEGWLNWRTYRRVVRGPENTTVTLKIRRGNQIMEFPVKRTMKYWDYYQLMQHHKKFEKIAEGIYYMNMDAINMEEIEKQMPLLEKAKAIICDLRGYPKNTIKFIQHLLKEKDTSDKWMRIPNVIYPDYKKVAYSHYSWDLVPVQPHLSAKIIFITDGRAISYAESYMSFIEHYKLATIVGAPTAGTNGNINPFTLPGGYRIGWTGMRVLKHDGSQLHGVGIHPHVPVKRTIAGVREGRDQLLEKAIDIAKN